MHTLTISLDGLENEHNWMRGNSDSFMHVDEAISMLVSVPEFTFDIVTCVNRRNYTQLEDIKNYLIEKKVRRWRIFSVFPNGRAANDPDMRLTTDEFRGMFEFIRDTRKEGLISVDYGCEGFLGNYEMEVRDHFYTCQAGISIASVMADGSISACTSIRADFSQGNIYKDDIMEVWENRYQQFRDRKWMKAGQCAACRYWRYCQGNGMHLHDGDGNLLMCHLNRLNGL
jgi:radical SAM enzyme (rSAM/lipoprotein system)